MATNISAPASKAQPASPSAAQEWVKSFKKTFVKNPVVLVCTIVIIALVFVALLADVIAPYNPEQQNLAGSLTPPQLLQRAADIDGQRYWLGSDHMGRDVLSRVIYGARISLMVGLISVFCASVAGTLLGAVAGYFRGWVDVIISRFIDILLAFPSLITTLALMAALGRSLTNVIIAISISILPRIARLIRGSVLSIRERDYVQASRALGATHVHIIFKHIIPNTIAPVLVYATLQIPSAIIAEAYLSFLGAGVPPPEPTWGNMASEGKTYLMTAPWIAIVPGAAIAVTVLAFNLLGDAIRDLLDPRLRQSV